MMFFLKRNRVDRPSSLLHYDALIGYIDILEDYEININLAIIIIFNLLIETT